MTKEQLADLVKRSGKNSPATEKAVVEQASTSDEEKADARTDGLPNLGVTCFISVAWVFLRWLLDHARLLKPCKRLEDLAAKKALVRCDVDILRNMAQEGRSKEDADRLDDTGSGEGCTIEFLDWMLQGHTGFGTKVRHQNLAPTDPLATVTMIGLDYEESMEGNLAVRGSAAIAAYPGAAKLMVGEQVIFHPENPTKIAPVMVFRHGPHLYDIVLQVVGIYTGNPRHLRALVRGQNGEGWRLCDDAESWAKSEAGAISLASTHGRIFMSTLAKHLEGEGRNTQSQTRSQQSGGNRRARGGQRRRKGKGSSSAKQQPAQNGRPAKGNANKGRNMFGAR
jgi:hypothetical protein